MLPLKHSCFISYVADQGELHEQFVIDLQRALESALKAQLPKHLEVFIDKDGLSGGNRIEPVLGRALCQSLAMVLVYTPNYPRSQFCSREYAAMKELERRRFAAVGRLHPGMGMIVPVIYRGERDHIPEQISGSIKCVDFTNYLTRKHCIMDSARWMGQIERLARDMYELYSLFEGAPIDDHFGCEDFELPAVPPADLWQGWGPKQAQGFPY